jgi:TolB protein
MKSRTVIFLVTSWMITSEIHSQNLGLFSQQTDVGSPVKRGNASYDAKTQTYIVNSGGVNIWGERDEFHYVYKKIKGNFILRLRGRLIGQGVDPHRKFGWMVRSSLDANSAHVNGVVHGDGLTSLQYRRTTGAQTEEIKSKLNHADIIQLERKGNKYILSVAKDGDIFVTSELEELALGDEVYVGLFACAHNKDVIEKANFDNVRIIIPAKENFVPYRDYIGSNLEIMDLATGNSKIIYRTPVSIQAPNWTRDGHALIYNSKGLLYRFDLAKKKPTLIPTGIATNNNNDHVLSFDGRMIGISHNNKDDNGESIVYTLPIKGGSPKKITPVGPSYLHSWSPDGKWLIYTARRNGEFDIYKVPSSGGEEIRLTDAKGLDDGSEFTPDGKYIWFNSTRSGMMQLWRMKPDGTEQEQMTNDEFNNWFPHISPDGKSIVFLSFGKEISPDDHPFYKHVYLRMMPAAGGTPKVIAYLYGGQATINVPSWSPDSKRIAFVSNSDE